ncbi:MULTISPECIES: phosphoribosyl-ATP diphosphatase [Stappiaceae]|uniref:phosphoribosyl-ATP diphosphatase n=1 Tax=Stappiaceae TaxID=2821832 RepID=UPI000B8C19D0|nr:phosphoribosyl-ATP diphosphatase [Labrenzia sp. VG12]ASP35204.1 phosphoribosyl-ATP diphosphatase [Labrenzia sp. VG12]
MTDFTLEQLDAIVTARATSDDEKSYTRKLVNKGVAKCAQKLGEEAVEAAIAAVQEDREELTAEAADVLYHLLVVLNVSNVPLQDVMKELGRRTGQTGLEEKASRPQD